MFRASDDETQVRSTHPKKIDKEKVGPMRIGISEKVCVCVCVCVCVGALANVSETECMNARGRKSVRV